jgi:putative nucleotidyltransferase with HDIG domain
MTRIQTLEKKVKELYDEKKPTRADWADWMFENHVLVVANNATKLAKQHHANEELSRAAALLHDIADATMKRSDKRHEQESIDVARKLMTELGYSEKEIHLVVDDAIRYHSCNGNEHPESIEGKILSTADSIAHLKTDFYEYAKGRLSSELSPEEINKFVLTKIERDINNKMFFDDVRKEVLPDYTRIKETFSKSK